MNIPIDTLADLLGEKNTEDLKKKIADVIVSRIKSDIKDYDRYIFYPPDYDDFFEECFEEAQAKVKETLVQKLYDDMMNAYQSKTNI